MTERAQWGDCTLYCGKAEAVLPTLPDASVQLIVVDPPYYRVKAEAWDRQWSSREAYLAWLAQLAKEWRRILTPNGSLYCFASPQMAAYVEVRLGEVFNIIQRITWRKPPYSTKAEMFDKDSCRMFFPASEAIIFAEQYGSDGQALGESGYASQCDTLHGTVFESLRAYLEGERKRAGISKADCNAACGFAPIAGAMASRHYFSPSQWCLPTKEHYQALQILFNTEGRQPAPPFADYHPANSVFATYPLRQEYSYLRQEYEDLRQEYEDLRQEYEDLRRPFTVSAAVPYTDVWDFATVSAAPGKHPCEKPLPLLRHMIEVSSRPGDTVLDCCMGSGSTLEAVQQCGRKAIGIDDSRAWWLHAQSRVAQLNLW